MYWYFAQIQILYQKVCDESATTLILITNFTPNCFDSSQAAAYWQY